MRQHRNSGRGAGIKTTRGERNVTLDYENFSDRVKESPDYYEISILNEDPLSHRAGRGFYSHHNDSRDYTDSGDFDPEL